MKKLVFLYVFALSYLSLYSQDPETATCTYEGISFNYYTSWTVNEEVVTGGLPQVSCVKYIDDESIRFVSLTWGLKGPHNLDYIINNLKNRAPSMFSELLGDSEFIFDKENSPAKYGLYDGIKSDFVVKVDTLALPGRIYVVNTITATLFVIYLSTDNTFSDNGFTLIEKTLSLDYK